MNKIYLLFSCLLLIGSAHADLAVVTIDDNSKIDLWLDLGYPSYEFIENIVIAEIPANELTGVVRSGLMCSSIDEKPWQDKYYIVDSKKAGLLPGKMIWQGDDFALLKVDDEKLLELYRKGVNIQPLRKAVLPDRFWRNIGTRQVSVRSLEWDPFIQGIVDQVNTDSLTAYIQRLQDFRSRLTLTDSSYAASAWLHQKFSGWGMTTAYDSFYVDSTMAAWGCWPDTGFERNVVATLEGSMNPSTEIIICGHFDAIVWWDTNLARYNAPGADDNATGTVAALEAARIFRNYAWEPSVKFIGWATEELGLYGSYHYAQRAESLGIDIAGVVNGDMIGYMDDSYLDVIIQRHANSPTWLSDLFEQAAQLYIPQLLVYPVTSGGGSDWYPFAVYGYPSVGSAARAGSHYNPHYHDTSDLLITFPPDLYTAITKAEIATLAILGLYPAAVRDVAAYDIGDGSSLQITWTPNSESDVTGYWLYWGRQSAGYSDSNYIAGINSSADTLNSLLTDSTYYIAVYAVDAAGHQSPAANEVIGVPRSFPAVPLGLTAIPVDSGVRLEWMANQELDLAGYRIYRRLNDNVYYDSLTIAMYIDTFYVDYPISGTNRYYYAIRAFDNGGNYSPMTDEVYGRPITLDQGIIMVDETRNGAPSPPDSIVDAFYRYIMNGYNYTEYDFGNQNQRPILADLVPFSTVIWHADDTGELMASGSANDLRTYLNSGGNLWFIGWKPVGNLRGVSSYPISIEPGSFIYDQLKISYVEITAMSDSFQGANGFLDYPRLDVDPLKVPNANWGGTMRIIEELSLVAPAETIYTMDMVNNGSPFENTLCGIRYLGSDHKVVLFGFPLYFMEQDDGRLVALKVMSDFEETGVAENPGKPNAAIGQIVLQNEPNPFFGSTVITYNVTDRKMVGLNVYNAAGQLIANLVNGVQDAGVHKAVWDGKDRSDRNLSSGIYFLRLESGEHRIVKKMILLH